ncbi:type IV secretory system conjugative DNA transfer family protein [Streptomyces sp. 4.24]|uniref:type IV secretory system conjugative DNA transfer family protein n=1 Tax=Streptomyces tritrimontium TaxID=3406573 RepID=UPI003BB5EB99
MATTGSTGGRGLRAGFAHLRAEYGRWWRTEDQSDNHIAHRVLNDQFRTWQRFQQRHKGEVQQNIGLLQQQQKFQRQAQLMQMNAQRQRHRRGGAGGYGGYGGGMGASPMIAYRMMQWAGMRMRISQQEFRHLEVTPQMLADARGRLRSRRHTTAFLTITTLLALWIGLWALSALGALVVTVGAALVLTLMAWSAGRRPTRRRPPVPRLLFVPPQPPAHTEMAEPVAQPFPIREAGRDPRRARESLAQAFLAEKAKISTIDIPQETNWGWTVPLVLSGGTLGDLIRVLPKLSTHLRVGDNRILASRTSAEDSAAITLRILTSDPFANPRPYPVRPPKSVSIADPFSIGLSIDGEDTPIVLAGQHVLIVADSGGGKSAMVRALAEYVTACTDAVAVDIDPTGRGLGPLQSCAARTARTPLEAEAELAYLHTLAQARIAALGPLEDNWTVTPTAPAVIAFLDEFPQLTKRGKELALAILRIGRKARVTLVVCSQDATADVMGDAIADAFGVRILMPCRQADVPLVVGQADAVSKGWLPHLLVPSPGEWEIADAGRYYCITPRHREPILRYVSWLDPAAAHARAKEREAAGLPALALPAPPAVVPVVAGAAPAKAVPPIAGLLIAAFATQSNPESMTIAQLAEYLEAADPAVWGQWSNRTDRDRLAQVSRKIKSELKASGLTIASGRLDGVPNRPSGYKLADIRGALS